MSKISVIRIDRPEENEVDLPRGEVSIGRGSVLGCDDKRISRKHGLLQVSNEGSITLVSMHTNPCFYKVQYLDAYTVLMKGQSKILSHGDEFALLPNSFQYRVVVKAEIEPISPVVRSEVLSVTIPKINNNEKNGTATEVKTESQELEIANNVHVIDNSTPDSLSITPSKRKRMLPGWLTNLPGNEPSSSTVTVDSSTTSTTVTARKRKGSTDSEDEEKRVKTEINEEPLDLDITIESVAHGQVGTSMVPDTSNLHQLSDNDDDDKPTTGQNKAGYEAEYGEASSTTTVTRNQDTAQNATSGPSREPCVYGATCYRKNPQHRRDFSHTGDADFNINKDLPECPFGTSCYRKNLLHRKDYKHTQPPHSPLSRSSSPPPPQANGDSSPSNINYYRCNITYNVCPKCQNTTCIDLTKDDKPEP